MILRSMHAADIDSLLLIERAVHVVPWNKNAFNICLQAKGNTGWLIENNGQPMGFVIVSFKIACHVLNLGIARHYQRQGLGKQLLEYVINHAKSLSAPFIYLEVRRSNIPAINLYKKIDFSQVGERKNYYPIGDGQYEDALIFARNLVGLE
jgi:ribosomal-protein-alanine acetyltransferase